MKKVLIMLSMAGMLAACEDYTGTNTTDTEMEDSASDMVDMSSGQTREQDQDQTTSHGGN